MSEPTNILERHTLGNDKPVSLGQALAEIAALSAANTDYVTEWRLPELPRVPNGTITTTAPEGALFPTRCSQQASPAVRQQSPAGIPLPVQGSRTSPAATAMLLPKPNRRRLQRVTFFQSFGPAAPGEVPAFWSLAYRDDFIERASAVLGIAGLIVVIAGKFAGVL